MNIKKVSASRGVLANLCLMYFITYVDRVNVSTAAVAFKQELGFSNTQIGFVFSAFAAIVSPVVAGWIIDTTGNWNLPFVGLMVLMLLGAGMAFAMKPDQPFSLEAN